MANPHTTSNPKSTQVSDSQEFHVGDYAAGKAGYYAGFVIAAGRRVWIVPYPRDDDTTVYGDPDEFTLIMPAAARAYFEQFIGDEGGE